MAPRLGGPRGRPRLELVYHHQPATEHVRRPLHERDAVRRIRDHGFCRLGRESLQDLDRLALDLGPRAARPGRTSARGSRRRRVRRYAPPAPAGAPLALPRAASMPLSTRSSYRVTARSFSLPRQGATTSRILPSVPGSSFQRFAAPCGPGPPIFAASYVRPSSSATPVRFASFPSTVSNHAFPAAVAHHLHRELPGRALPAGRVAALRPLGPGPGPRGPGCARRASPRSPRSRRSAGCASSPPAPPTPASPSPARTPAPCGQGLVAVDRAHPVLRLDPLADLVEPRVDRVAVVVLQAAQHHDAALVDRDGDAVPRPAVDAGGAAGVGQTEHDAFTVELHRRS